MSSGFANFFSFFHAAAALAFRPVFLYKIVILCNFLPCLDSAMLPAFCGDPAAICARRALPLPTCPVSLCAPWTICAGFRLHLSGCIGAPCPVRLDDRRAIRPAVRLPGIQPRRDRRQACGCSAGGVHRRGTAASGSDRGCPPLQIFNKKGLTTNSQSCTMRVR